MAGKFESFTCGQCAGVFLATPLSREDSNDCPYTCPYCESGETENTNLHKMHLGLPAGSAIHHIDGDPLNNKLSNLRVVTLAENSR